MFFKKQNIDETVDIVRVRRTNKSISIALFIMITLFSIMLLSRSIRSIGLGGAILTCLLSVVSWSLSWMRVQVSKGILSFGSEDKDSRFIKIISVVIIILSLLIFSNGIIEILKGNILTGVLSLVISSLCVFKILLLGGLLGSVVGTVMGGGIISFVSSAFAGYASSGLLVLSMVGLLTHNTVTVVGNNGDLLNWLSNYSPGLVSVIESYCGTSKDANQLDYDGSNLELVMPGVNEQIAEDEEQITCNVYSGTFAVEKGSSIPLSNPSTNTVYFIYSVSLNGEVLYKTNRIEPGKQVNWVVSDVLQQGTYDLILNVDAYDVKSGVQCQGFWFPLTIIYK